MDKNKRMNGFKGQKRGWNEENYKQNGGEKTEEMKEEQK